MIARISDPFTEWTGCARLRQSDIDSFTSAGVPILALANGPDGRGFGLTRDDVAVDGGRFEFARYARDGASIRSATIVLALDRWCEPADLVAFQCGANPFVATWLGRVGLLGEEGLDDYRFDEPLLVHASPLDWLRAGREGVCVVDRARAASMLRDAGTMEVGTYAERRRLLDVMGVRMPQVLVRTGEGRRAA